MSEFAPLALVEQIAHEFATDARQRRCQVLGFAYPDLPSALIGDSAVISSLLRLLTKNALESVAQAKDGAVLVEALTHIPHSHNLIRLGVSDNRTHVTADAAAKIISNIEQQPTELGTCRELLKSLRTTLEAETKLLGRATRFFFSIPLTRAAAAEPGLPPISREMAESKMLLVANDPGPNRTIAHYCRHEGIDFAGCTTADEAIIELGRAGTQYDLLAVAPPIGDMTPMQIAQEVRKSQLKDMKLLYIAPWDDPLDRRAHLEAGFDDTLAKPFTKAQLFNTLGRLARRIPRLISQAPLVLVVEDNSINAQLASFQLRRLGFQSEIVTNGREALTALERGTHSAVLMDMQMPVMDGLETIKQIRSRETQTGKYIPIVALTANEDKRSSAMEAGCDYFLTKPAALEQLKQTLWKCIPNTSSKQ